MSYIVIKKITPIPEPDGYNNITEWKSANGSSHGTKAGVILSSSWELHEDTKSAVIALEYDDKDTFERHQLRQPEDYGREFIEVILDKQ